MKNENVIKLIDYCKKEVSDAEENKDIARIEESISNERYYEGAEHMVTKIIMKLNEILESERTEK